MKKFFLTMTVILGSLGLYAQNAQNTASDTLRVSLQDCINYALKNNVNIKNATLDEEISAARVREVRGIGLPQINGSIGVQHYFKLRDQYLNKNGLSRFGGDSTQIAAIQSLPNNVVAVSNNLFQLPSTLDANVSASQILFNASYLVGLQAAKTYKELSRRTTQQTKEQTANAVKKAYYQQMINFERIKLYDVNINRLDSSLKQTQALQANGFAESIDVDRLEVSYNNLLTEYEKTLNLLILSSLALKFQMGMPLEQNLILIDSLNTFVADTSYKSNKDFNYRDRTDYQLLLTQLKLNKTDVKNNRSALLPNLVASATLGTFTSNNDLNFFSTKPYLYTNSDGSTRIENKAINWSNYGFIQVGLNVPIFSGFQRSSKIQQSKITVQKNENSIKNFERTIDIQVRTAKINLSNSFSTLQIQKRNMELAKKVTGLAYKRYGAGTGSNLEVTNAEAALKESQVNYFGALYDYLVFKVDYEQAAGLNKF